MAERLRRARIDAGYESAQAAAEAFGWHAGAYRHHENGTRGFDVETAKRYARALKVNPGWLLALDTIKAPQPIADQGGQELEVAGLVQAGIWREQAELPASDRYKVKVGPPPFPGAERFAVRLEGLSMNKVIPPGSDLECLRVQFGAVEPLEGDLVIVERQAHDLTEMTCKRLIRAGGEWMLRAESTEPEFQEEIRLGKSDKSLFVDNPIRVVGIVLRAIQRHFRRT